MSKVIKFYDKLGAPIQDGDLVAAACVYQSRRIRSRFELGIVGFAGDLFNIHIPDNKSLLDDGGVSGFSPQMPENCLVIPSSMTPTSILNSALYSSQCDLLGNELISGDWIATCGKGHSRISIVQYSSIWHNSDTKKSDGIIRVTDFKYLPIFRLKNDCS